MNYWKTWHEGKTRTHLDGIGDSYTLCGVDTAGDDLVHDRDPERLHGMQMHVVTCEDCQQIIAIVRDHLDCNASFLPIDRQ